MGWILYFRAVQNTKIAGVLPVGTRQGPLSQRTNGSSGGSLYLKATSSGGTRPVFYRHSFDI